jgi:hypothetical protein
MLLGGLLPAIATEVEPLRVAVLTTTGLPLANLGDLVTAALGAEPGVELVERDQIEAVLRELELATVLGADAPGERLKLGALLHADLLVLLGPESDAGTRYVRLVICDTRVGARLTQDRLTPDDGPEALTAAICERVRATRARLAAGVERVVAIPPFVSRSLTHELDHLQQKLPHVLEEAFSALPGTAVLEVEEVRAIQRELDLRGGGLKARVVPWFINGEYRQEGTLTQPNATLSLALTLTDGAALQREVRHTFTSVEELAGFLRAAAVPELVGDVSGTAPLSVAQQLARMEERATAFDRLGRFDLGAEIREACLLFAPDDVATNTRLLRRYAALVKARPFPAWYEQPTEQVRAAWTARPAQWRRSLELLEHLIRRELITQYEALTLSFVLDDSIYNFIHLGPDNPPQGYDVHDPELLELFDRELAACTQVQRRFQLELFPQIRNLPVGKPDEDWQRRGTRDPRLGWYGGLFSYPDHRRQPAGFVGPEVTPELLEHYAGVVTRERSSAYGLCQPIAQVLERFATDPPAQHRATPDDFTRFLATLETTGDPVDAAYARLGRLLYQRYRLPNDQRPADAVLSEEAVRVEQEFRRATGDVPQALLRLRRDLAGQSAPERPTTWWQVPRAPTMRLTGPEEATRELQFERVYLRVRMSNGQEEPFGEVSWADQPGFVSQWCPPWGLTRVGSEYDLLWAACYVLVQREPGLLEPIVLDRSADVRSVNGDATHIWVASRSHGLQVFDLAGHLLQTVDARSGLPPYDRELTLTLLPSGQAAVAGSFGPQARAWCARVDIDPQPPLVDILLEATESEAVEEESRADPSDFVRAAERREREAHQVFVPWRLDTYRDPRASGRPLVLISRRNLSRNVLRPLLVDPELRTVRLTGYLADVTADHVEDVSPLFLPDGNFLVPNEERIVLLTPPGRTLDDGKARRVVYEDLRCSHASLEWADDGYLYAPTLRYWTRIDPETLAVESLGLRPQFQPQAGDDEYAATSAHYGLVIYTSAGKFFKVHLAPRMDEPGEALPPRVHALRLLDADSQAPLAQGTVELEWYGLHRTLRTDERGQAEIPARWENSIATALAEGYEQRFVVLRAGRHAAAKDGRLTVSLRPLLRLGGQVVDARGEPAAGARVRVRRGKVADPNRQSLGETVTDAQGRWTLLLLPQEKGSLGITFSAGQNTERVLNPTTEEWTLLEAGQHVWHLRLDPRMAPRAAAEPEPTTSRVLPPGVQTGFDVLVCDSTGQPVADAEITWDDAGPGEQRRKPQMLRTDASGRGTIPGPFRSALAVRHTGYADHVEPPQFPRPAGGLCTVRLQAATPVTVRVVDPNDVPLPDAQVSCFCSLARSLYAKKGSAGADGALSWDFAPTGAIQWAVAQHGKELELQAAEFPAQAEVLLRVRRRPVVHVFGEVTDSASAQPVPEFQATVRRADAPPGRPAPGSRPGTFVAGRFDLYLEEPAGSYELRLEATGYVPVRVPVALADDPDVRLDVQLRASTGLRVLVQRPDGSPAASVDVLGTVHELIFDHLPLTPRWTDDDLRTTNDSGIAVLSAQLGGRALLAADENSMGLGTADENAAEATIVLSPWPGVEGTWERLPDGLPEIRLKLNPIPREPSASRTVPNLQAVVGPDGRFEFPRLLPGEYSLYREVWLQATEHSGRSTQVRQTRVTVEPGQRVRLDVKATGRPVVARLVHQDGTPVDGRELSGALTPHPQPKQPANWRELSPLERETWSRANARTAHLQFDGQGGLLAHEVAPGTYRLSVEGEVPSANGFQSIRVRSREVVVPACPEGEPPTRYDVGEINADAPEAQRPAAKRSASPPGPPEKRDWQVLGLQAGAGAAVVGALVVGIRRRFRTRSGRRSQGPVLPLLLLGLGLAGSSPGWAQDAAEPDASPLLPIVRATEVFQRDCGLWPQRLEDLVPQYIHGVPPACKYEWSWTGYVHVACSSAGQQLVFVFNGDDRGWYAGTPRRFRPLSIPPPAPAAPPRPQLELLQAAGQEFDRRIEREPNNPEHRQAKIAFFYAAAALAEARQAALDWVTVDPRAMLPRYALADIARKERSGLENRWGGTHAQYDIRQAWAARDLGSYGLWRLFADPDAGDEARSKLPRMLQGPLYKDRSEWLFAELYLAEDAEYLAHGKHLDQLLALCAKWEATAQEITDPPPDRTYHLYRTIAHLRRQEYDAAAAEYAKALAAFKERRCWRDPQYLESFVRQRRELPEEFERTDYSENDWRMKLNCPPPER